MPARSYFNIATMYQEREDAQRSLDASGKGRGVLVQAGRAAPSVTSYQVDLGNTYYLKAWTEHQLGRESDSLALGGPGPEDLQSPHRGRTRESRLSGPEGLRPESRGSHPR